MADTPTPRSYQQILGDIADAFISRTGIASLKPGSPLLSLMEAVAQSQMRDSEDLFNLLNSISLDRSTGEALDAIAADEGIARRSATSAFGYVTFTDTRFSKVQTVLATSTAVGANVLKVQDVSQFDLNDHIIIDKNQENEEGANGMTAIIVTGIDTVAKTLSLNTTLAAAHGSNATVLKRQYGDRIIPAMTSVGSTVIFNTISEAIIEDGEIVVENVPVVCGVSGTTGNVGSDSIMTVNSSLPITGVTNPLAFVNAIDQETDDSLRQRVRIARQTKQKATPLAIREAVLGTVSTSEGDSVISASLIDTGLGKATLYIDNGTGYEAKTSPIAFETLVASAAGGEQYFELRGGRPVSKAFVISNNSAPFTLDRFSSLVVSVGSTIYVHRFNMNDFVDPSKATAYEIVASINENTNLGFFATTTANKTKIKILPKADVNETIRVFNPLPTTYIVSGQAVQVAGVDPFSFPKTPASTMYLFKNEQLLVKDGKEAVVYSSNVASWSDLPPTVTEVKFSYLLDESNVPVTITITDEDFRSVPDSGGSIFAGQKKPSVWAAVLDKLMIGVSAASADVGVILTSNKGLSSKARLEVLATDNDLYSLMGMFGLSVSVGLDNDYTLNRNKGQIYLASPLIEGDSLIAGSIDVRAPLTARVPYAVPYTSPGFEAFWVVTDEPDFNIVPTDIKNNETFDIVNVSSGPSTPPLVKLKANPSVIDSVQAGDWAIFFDSAFGIANGSWTKQVYATGIDAGVPYLDFVRDGSEFPAGSVTLNEGGLVFCRSSEPPQRVVVDSYNTNAELQDQINEQLVGAHCKINSDETKLTLYSNSYASSGNISVICFTQTLGSAAGWFNGQTASNPSDFDQSVVSSSDTSVPAFRHVNADVDPISGSPIEEYVGGINVFTTVEPHGLSEESGYKTEYSDSTSYRSTLNDGSFYANDQKSIYSGYQLSDTDTLNLLFDKDTDPQNVSAALSVDATISSSNRISLSNGVDPDVYFNAQSLNDWAIWNNTASAICASSISSGDVNVEFQTKTYGPNNPISKVELTYPKSASQPYSENIESGTNGVLQVVLPSGTARTPTLAADQLLYVAPALVDKTQKMWLYFHGEVSADETYILVSASAFPNISRQSIVIGGYLKLESVPQPFQVVDIVDEMSGDCKVYTNLPLTGRALNMVYFSSTETNPNSSDPAFGDVVVGDLCNNSLANTVSLPADRSFKITSVASDSEYAILLTGGPTPSLVVVQPAQYLSFFALGTALLSTLNSSYVTVKTTSSAPLLKSTQDFYLYDPTSIAADGVMGNSLQVNYVSTCNSTYDITTKKTQTFDGTLVKLVPVTAKNVATSLNAYLAFKMVNATDTENDGRRVEISRSQEGADSTLQVVGGTANSAILQIVSSGNDYLKVYKEAIGPFVVGNTVQLYSEKAKTFPAKVVDLEFNDHFLLSSAKLWNLWSPSFSTPSATPYIPQSVRWSVKRIGNYAVLRADSSLSSFSDLSAKLATVPSFGSFVHIALPSYEVASVSGSDVLIDNLDAAMDSIGSGDVFTYFNGVGVSAQTTVTANVVGGYTVSSVSGIATATPLTIKANAVSSPLVNRTYRVVAVDSANASFWIEAPNAIDGTVLLTTLFLSNDSVVPEDALDFAYAGASTMPQRLVVDKLNWSFKEIASDYISARKGLFYKSTSSLPATTESGVKLSNTRATAESGYAVIDAAYADVDPLLVNIKLSGSYPNWFSYGPKAYASAMNKLGFSLTDTAKNANGYNYYTGLVGQSNKIIYGDQQDPINYPGYASANANIEVLPSQVKRVRVSVVVRMFGGFSQSDTSRAIRDAVSSAVALTPVGQDVAFSDLVAAVNAIPGVYSAYVTNMTTSSTAPVYSATNTVINVQSFEKALILDPNKDVQITYVGS